MLLYAETGEEPQEFRGNERFLWPTAKLDIDRTALKSETNKANGSKPKRLEATLSEAERTEAKSPIKKSNINIKKENLLTEIKEKNTRFLPPTVEEVDDYCKYRGNGVDAQKFVDFYASKGWKVGNSPMKDWRACVRTWEKRDTTKKVVAQDFNQRDYSNVQSEMMDNLAKEMDAFLKGEL